MKKLVYISNSPIPSRSASSVHVMKMCAAIAKRGVEVQLLTPRMSTDTSFEGSIHEYYGVANNFNITFLPWPGRILPAYIYAMYVVKELNKHKADFVYGRFPLGVFVSTILGLPSSLEVHTSATDMGWPTRCILKLLFSIKNFSRLVVISKSLETWYLHNYPELTDRTMVLHDGADESSLLTPTKVIDEYGFNVGYVGHLYPGKGMELIVPLARLMPELNFGVVGGTEDWIEFWKKKSLPKNLKLYGYVPPSKLHDYFSAFDCFLAPYQTQVSVYGGKGNVASWMSPLKLFEYMSYGKPVVCSDLPVLREILENEKTALLVPSNDVKAWSGALRRLMESKKLRLDLGNAAKIHFMGTYTWTKRAEKLKEHLKW